MSARGFFLMFEAFAADPDAEHSLRAQTNDRTKRLLQAQTAIAKIMPCLAPS